VTSAAAVLLTVMVAWNPALVVERAPSAGGRRRLGMVLAAALGLGLALAADPLLDVLDVSVPTFQTAAGTVVAVTGARWLAGPRPLRDEGDPLLLGVIDVGTPALFFAVVATSAASGWWPTAIAVGVVAAATAGLRSVALPEAAVRWLRRLLAGSAVGLGVALIYAGIRAV
jgi:small neutral amino acid transporter SnatA (MarC family)